MFDRGITDKFANALAASKQWEKISEDKELYFAMRAEYVNVYYQGCSIFKISYENTQLCFRTHYKYLIHPYMNDPYILWNDKGNLIKERVDSGVFIDILDTKLLKKAASSYAVAEKKGIHSILKSNKNIVDVEVSLSAAAENEQNSEDEIDASKPHADRIDFVALQQIDGTARIVFFEAKRFENPELRAKGVDAPVLGQIRKYEKLIAENEEGIRTSYLKVCKNLHKLVPERWDHLVKEVAEGAVELTVAPRVRLVVFGYDADEDVGAIWGEHKAKLRKELKERLLSKGDPKGFVTGISKY